MLHAPRGSAPLARVWLPVTLLPLLVGLGVAAGCAPKAPASRCGACPAKPPEAAPRPAPRGATPAGSPTTELHRAVAAAWAKLKALGRAPGDYHLVGAERLYRLRPALWRVTFKPKRLIPADPMTQPIGAGGEVFVNVDLAAGTTEVRYGE